MNLDEIKRRLDKATPGPWVVERQSFDDGFAYELSTKDRKGNYTLRTAFHERDYDGELIRAKFDSEFVANAPTDIAWLIEKLEQAIKIMKEIKSNQNIYTMSCDCGEEAELWLEVLGMG